MYYIQSATPWLVSNDSFYHVRMAERLPEWGFIREFPWLHWTFFRENFVSHHYGFHILIAPFVIASERIAGDAMMGGKIATIFYSALTSGLLCEVLRRLGVRQRILWVLLLCCAPWHYWLRMSYTRAQIVEMPLLLLTVIYCMGGRVWLLGLLGFLSTHIYLGAVMYPLVPLAFLPGDALAALSGRAGLNGEGRPWGARAKGKLIEMLRLAAPPAAAGFGILVGMVISPYFPANFPFLATQLFETGLGSPDEVGVEWKSYQAREMLLMSLPYVILWLGAATLRFHSGIALDRRGFGMFFLNIGFLGLTIWSRRFIEYWPMFALLNIADMASVPIARRRRVSQGTPVVRESDLRAAEVFGRGAESGGGAGVAVVRTDTVTPGGSERASRSAWINGVMLALILGVAARYTLLEVRKTVNPSANVPALRDAMMWLKENTPARSMVLTDDWDIFPHCFYFNQHNTFAVGLDPVFTQRLYPRLWDRYRIITRGESPGTLPPVKKNKSGKPLAPLDPNPSDLRVTLGDIGRVFKAEYVLVAADHQPLYRQLIRATDRFELVYPVDLATTMRASESGFVGSTRPASVPRQPAIALFRVLPPAEVERRHP